MGETVPISLSACGRVRKSGRTSRKKRCQSRQSLRKGELSVLAETRGQTLRQETKFKDPVKETVFLRRWAMRLVRDAFVGHRDCNG
jgi:hypothetical protein